MSDYKIKNNLVVQGSSITIGGVSVPTISSAETLTNKTIDADLNTISNIENADIKVGAAIDASKIADGSVSSAEFQFINSLSSNAQTQLDARVVGPASATDEALARFDGTTGKLVQNSVISATDAGVMSGITQLNVDNLRLDGNTLSSTDTNGDVILDPNGTGITRAVGALKSDTSLILEDPGAGTNTVTIQAPTLAGSYTLTLPVDDGASSQVLQTDGSGVLSWATVATSDQFVKISAADTTAGYLNSKVVAGSGIATAILNGGGDEDLQVSLDINGLTTETAPAAGDLIPLYDLSATANRKMTRANFLGAANPVTGDIGETSFSIANNQAAAADVTGLAFANGSVRSFSAQAYVFIDATSDLFEVFELRGVQKSASWDLSVNSTGDLSLVEFTITSSGQIQYTSATYAGFVAGLMKFRALALTV